MLLLCALSARSSSAASPWPPELTEEDPPAITSLLDEHAQTVEADHEFIPTEAPDHEIVPQSFTTSAQPHWLNATWNHGLELESADKAFRVHVGGRVQVDGTWYNGEDDVLFGPAGIGDLRDAVNLRRARLRVDGKMYDVYEWAAEFDFVNQVNDEPLLPPTNATAVNVPAPTELWFQINDLPVVGHLRMGQFKEPIGMEHLTSSRFLPFMERSFLQDAFFGPFNNGFSPGIMAFDWAESERATWWLGGFKNVNNGFGSGVGDGEYAATGRITVLPWYEDDGARLLHLGVAGSYRNLDDGLIRIRSRASLRSGNPGPFNPIITDTLPFAGDAQSLLVGEAAAVCGPLTLQSEYAAAVVDDAVIAGNDETYLAHGWYAQALWFLTGEHQNYNKKTGVFDRVVPKQNCHPCRPGCGAWQIGARYAFLDLRDAGIEAAVVQDVTLGLNWFWNPNAKIQFNYVWTDRDAVGNDSDGAFHGAGTRVAFDF